MISLSGAGEDMYLSKAGSARRRPGLLIGVLIAHFRANHRVYLY